MSVLLKTRPPLPWQRLWADLPEGLREHIAPTTKEQERCLTDVEGYLWAKAGFGAMLAVTALADAPMAELIDRHRRVMYAVAEEVYRVIHEGRPATEAYRGLLRRDTRSELHGMG